MATSKLSKEDAQKLYEEAKNEPIVSAEYIDQARSLENVRISAIQEITRLTNKATRAVEDIIDSEESSPQNKLKAAKMIYDYAIGRPREAKYLEDSDTFANTNKAKTIIISNDCAKGDVRRAIGECFYGEGEIIDAE